MPERCDFSQWVKSHREAGLRPSCRKAARVVGNPDQRLQFFRKMVEGVYPLGIIINIDIL